MVVGTSFLVRVLKPMSLHQCQTRIQSATVVIFNLELQLENYAPFKSLRHLQKCALQCIPHRVIESNKFTEHCIMMTSGGVGLSWFSLKQLKALEKFGNSQKPVFSLGPTHASNNKPVNLLALTWSLIL